MFGLFGKKNKKQYHAPALTTEEKEWVEFFFTWLTENLGLQKMREGSFYTLRDFNLTRDTLSQPSGVQAVFEKVCKCCEVDPSKITLKIFDDVMTHRWSNSTVPPGEIYEKRGTFHREDVDGKHHYFVRIAKSTLETPELAIGLFAREISKIKMVDEEFLKINDHVQGAIADIATIFLGFGIFVANNVLTRDKYWLGRETILRAEVVGYANALLCLIAGQNGESYSADFNINTSGIFLNDYNYLVATKDTVLTADAIARAELKFEMVLKNKKGFATRQFQVVMEASEKLLEFDQNDLYALNNIGYAYLLQKQYERAIIFFTKAISIDPYFDFAINNRGYCLLYFGKLEDAISDLETAMEMNPENSFSWRNLGAYYLMTGDAEKAMEYFKEALRLDASTELIHFYLGHTHLNLGDSDSAQLAFEKSKEKKEYNDSMLQDVL